MISINRLALALGLSVANVAALLDHPALWPDLGLIDGLRDLPQTSVSISAWNAGDLSQGCRDRASSDGINPGNMRQYTVKLGDCSQPWYVCQENGAPLSIQDLANNFAKLPVRMRQWVNNVVHFKDGGGAYAYAQNIVFKGTSASVPVMIHESTHCVDGGGGFYSMHSSDQEWVDAYNRDSAVPDNYARSSQAENLAQFPGLIIFDRWTNGALQSYPELPRIGHQLQKVSDQADWNSPYGGRILDITSSGVTCTARYPLDGTVRARSGETVAQTSSAQDAAIDFMTVPEATKQAPTKCDIQ